MELSPAITEKLKSCELPPLPELVQKILRLTQDAFCDPSDIADMVKMDIALSTSVLKIANSVAFGYAGKVSSVYEAISRIGLTRMRDMVLSVSLVRQFREMRGIDFQQFWNHCLAVGMAAEAIERHAFKTQRNREYTYTAGLLHKVGILLLAQNFPELYQKVLDEVAHEEKDLWELEKEIIGVTHNEASDFLFRHWQFPVEVSAAALYYNDPVFAPVETREIIYIVHIANFSCLNLGIGVGIDRFPLSFFDEAWNSIGLDVEEVPELLAEVSFSAQHAKSILELS
jgi:HD-like signal output (HDOD) protein